MDRLPLELLRLISTFVEQEPIPRIRQGALAALARTNRTFHSIVNSRLYLHPVLFNEKRAEKWTNVYSSRITPWTVNDGKGPLQDIIVPESILFKYDRNVDKLDINEEPIFTRLDSRFDSSHLFAIALTPFFFRNLTSLTVSTYYPINDTFVAELLGPTTHNRLTIRKLNLQSQATTLIWFLFGAMYYIEHAVSSYRMEEILDNLGGEIGIEKGTDLDEVSDEDWEEIFDLSQKLAPSKWSVYELMRPELRTDDEYYEDIVESRSFRPTPFSRLRNLILSFDTNVEFYLIFLVELFPSLRYLTLKGELMCSDHLEDDVKMLRASITKRKGSLLPPSIDDDVPPFYPNLFDTWGPLSNEEFNDYVHKPYRGPKLKKLDLSSCRIILPSAPT